MTSMTSMTSMTGALSGPVARILLRYGAGGLVFWGLLSQQLADRLAIDPDVIAVTTAGLDLAIGLASAVAVEGYYWAAKRLGWPT